MESWKDSVKHKLADVMRLYNEVKGVELGTVVTRELYDTASADNVELRKEVRSVTRENGRLQAELDVLKN